MTFLVGVLSAIATLAALSRLPGEPQWVIEPYAGAFRMDDGERNHDPNQKLDPQGIRPVVGLRGLIGFGPSWEAGVGYGLSRFESTLRSVESPQPPPGTFEVRVQSILGEVRRAWPFNGVDLVASAGAGVLGLDAGQLTYPSRGLGPATADVAPPDPDRELDPLLSLGFGARRALTTGVAASAELRDMVHFCRSSSGWFDEASNLFCDRTAWLHHLQLTTAIRIEL